MFLASLNLEQKEAFLKLALKFISVDEEVKPAERQMLEVMALEMAVDQESLKLKECLNQKVDTSIDDILSVFADRDAQQIVLTQLYIIAYSDSRMAYEENYFIEMVIAKFGIDREKADRLKEWVKKQGELIEEIMDIWD